jgi:hypothetical protein
MFLSLGDRVVNRFKILVVALALLPMAPAVGSEKPEGDRVARLMQRKLQRAQKVLEGVAVKDFDMIGKNAEELIEISKQAGWKVLKTNEYEFYSKDFRRIAEALISNAKAQNIDAAALSYVDLTLTCVKCHKHVREERMVRR